MSDTINRQAAIDAIHKDADWLASQGSDWQVERMERDKSILRSLPSAEPEQRWIPCSERLPEDGTYLVYAPDYQGGSSGAKEWHDGVMFSKCKNGKWSIEHGYYERPNCVKAWMPLPEEWKGERDER